MTAPRPRHAAPCLLAALRWGHAMQWVVFGVVSVGAITAAATVGPSPHGAPAEAPRTVIAQQRTIISATAGPVGVPVGDLSAGPPIAASAPRSGSPPSDTTPVSALAGDGIPATALSAYQSAAQGAAATDPGCGLPWPLLAAIGRVESDHGRFAGAVLHADGVSTPRIIGIPLDGNGTALIRDTDGGRLDGDTVYDRAVGPMQFIPSTWAGYGRDGNGDGIVDPFNIFDAAAAAARYLCAAGGDLTTLAGQAGAVLAYNHDATYVDLVLRLERAYADGAGATIPVIPPDGGYSIPPIPPLPPVNPGTPPAAHGPGTPSPVPTRASSTSPAGGATGCPTATDSPTGTRAPTAMCRPPATTPPSVPSAPTVSDPPTSEPPTTDPPTSAPATTAPGTAAGTAGDTASVNSTSAPAAA